MTNINDTQVSMKQLAEQLMPLPSTVHGSHSQEVKFELTKDDDVEVGAANIESSLVNPTTLELTERPYTKSTAGLASDSHLANILAEPKFPPAISTHFPANLNSDSELMRH